MNESLTTSDTFYHGKVVIKQLKKGYRFAVDSPILADFLPVSAAPALEIGCGVGVVSLLALHLKKFPAITGVEIQEPLFRLAVDNAAANGMSWKVLCHPWRFQTYPCRLDQRADRLLQPALFQGHPGPSQP